LLWFFSDSYPLLHFLVRCYSIFQFCKRSQPDKSCLVFSAVA
jgi:hypothetical protein